MPSDRGVGDGPHAEEPEEAVNQRADGAGLHRPEGEAGREDVVARDVGEEEDDVCRADEDAEEERPGG